LTGQAYLRLLETGRTVPRLDARIGSLASATVARLGQPECERSGSFGDGTVVVRDSALTPYRIMADVVRWGHSDRRRRYRLSRAIRMSHSAPRDRTFSPASLFPAIVVATARPRSLSLEKTFGGGTRWRTSQAAFPVAPFLTLLPPSRRQGCRGPPRHRWTARYTCLSRSERRRWASGPLEVWQLGLGLQSDGSVVVAGIVQQSFVRLGGWAAAAGRASPRVERA